jgi:alpha-amylase/alpha-mannosidase (GH57 family)
MRRRSLKIEMALIKLYLPEKMDDIWEKLPDHISRRIIDEYIKNCKKQKSIQALTKYIIDKIRNHDENAIVSFFINAQKDNNTHQSIQCLLDYNCIFIIERNRKPTDICIAEHNSTEFVIGPYNETNVTKADKILNSILIKFFDSASADKFSKPICRMYDKNSPLLLPVCNDLYINQ